MAKPVQGIRGCDGLKRDADAVHQGMPCSRGSGAQPRFGFRPRIFYWIEVRRVCGQKFESHDCEVLSSPVAAGNFTSSAPTATPFCLRIPRKIRLSSPEPCFAGHVKASLPPHLRRHRRRARLRLDRAIVALCTRPVVHSRRSGARADRCRAFRLGLASAPSVAARVVRRVPKCRAEARSTTSRAAVLGRVCGSGRRNEVLVNIREAIALCLESGDEPRGKLVDIIVAARFPCLHRRSFSGRECVSALGRLGYVQTRQRGSHVGTGPAGVWPSR